MFLNNKDESSIEAYECILWQIFNEIVENQDLNRNKEDL